MLRVIATNDDGINAPGLWSLVRAIRPISEVIVCAPDRDKSGVGASLTLTEPIRAAKFPSRVEGVEAYGVEGTPGDAAILAIKEIAGDTPDLLVSGINAGNNISFSVTLSGTVGAAHHARLAGIPAIAFSAHTMLDFDNPRIAEVIRVLVQYIARTQQNSPSLLNVNFPSVDPKGCDDHAHDPMHQPLAGIMLTTLAITDPVYEITTQKRGRRSYFWNNVRDSFNLIEADMDDSDLYALIHGYISVTPLNRSLCSAQSTKAEKLAIDCASEVLRKSS